MSILIDVRPPPGLGLEGEADWWTLYETCKSDYTNVEGYGQRDAVRSASAAALGLRRPAPRLRRFPDPGDLVSLGLCLAIDVARPGGRIEVLAWSTSDRVQLWWSKKLTACLIYPKLDLGRCSENPTPSDHALVRKWTEGRYRAAAACRAVPPTPPVATQGPAVAVTYQSKKYDTGRKTTVYMHHHDRGVVVYESSGREPEAIMIRGGRLRLTSLGLDG